MKALHISLILFAILAICIVVNVIFIHRTADRLLELSSDVPTESSLAELEKFWESRKEFVGLSISEVHVDNVSRLIIAVRHAYESKNEFELRKNLALLSDAAEGIKRYERLSLENIF